MNYLKELQAFYDSLDICPLSSSHISLWIALLQLCNRNNWSEWFTPKMGVLESYSGLSRASVIRNREDLINAGYIKYKSKGAVPGEYKVIPCIERCINPCFKMIQDVIQEVIQDNNIYNILNKTKTETKTKTPPKSPMGDMPVAKPNVDFFSDFWCAYPKKTAKEQARKAFEKLKVSEDMFKLMTTALEQQKKTEEWNKEGGKYIPYPATWLNGKRWEDEVYAPSHTYEKEYKDFDEVFGNGN